MGKRKGLKKSHQSVKVEPEESTKENIEIKEEINEEEVKVEVDLEGELIAALE